MADGDALLGRPLSEVTERLSSEGTKFTVRVTAEVGRPALERRAERDALVVAATRVLQVRENDQGLELVVGPAFRRADVE